MSTHRLRARLDRIEQALGPAPGHDRDRDRLRRTELSDRKLSPRGLTEAEKAELAKLDALFHDEDRDRARLQELSSRNFRHQLELDSFSDTELEDAALTPAEQTELAELQRRFPPSPAIARLVETYRMAVEEFERSNPPRKRRQRSIE
jgi:DNA repair ATPase RecN